MRYGMLSTIVLAAVIYSFAAKGTPEDKYRITPAEHAACDADVVNLCAGEAEDEDQLIACMRAKRAQLTPACISAFDAGLRRRHLPL